MGKRDRVEDISAFASDAPEGHVDELLPLSEPNQNAELVTAGRESGAKSSPEDRMAAYWIGVEAKKPVTGMQRLVRPEYFASIAQ